LNETERGERERRAGREMKRKGSNEYKKIKRKKKGGEKKRRKEIK
jgi:hypothetical protein